MDPKDTESASNPSDRKTADIPITQLVVEAYESAAPAVRRRMLTQLIGQVYEAAPLLVRGRLLEHLLQPLGVLSLVAVANGVFAKIRFRSEWQNLQVGLEDARNVRVSDVLALADHVQQVSVDAVNGLAQMLAASPVMAGSAAAAVLVTVLAQRARTRRAGDSEAGDSSPVPT